jgi:hypothetical protein
MTTIIKQAIEKIAQAHEDARNSRRGKILSKIAAAVNAIPGNHRAEIKTIVGWLQSNVVLLIDGVRCYVEIDEELYGLRNIRFRGLAGQPNGKWRVVVEEGTWRRKSFPQRVDGSHNYNAIAWILVQRVEKQQVQARTISQAVGDAKKLIEAIRTVIPNYGK